MTGFGNRRLGLAVRKFPSSARDSSRFARRRRKEGNRGVAIQSRKQKGFVVVRTLSNGRLITIRFEIRRHFDGDWTTGRTVKRAFWRASTVEFAKRLPGFYAFTVNRYGFADNARRSQQPCATKTYDACRKHVISCDFPAAIIQCKRSDELRRRISHGVYKSFFLKWLLNEIKRKNRSGS